MKVTGPMMSIDASGTFAGTLTASKWKGRNYFRKHAIPSNPKSAAQTAFRAMFKFLGSQWSQLDTAAQQTWATMADNAAVSPFNSYQGYNQSRWRNFNAPTQSLPAESGETPATVSAMTATAGVRQITLDITLTTLTTNWGLIVFRKETSAPSNIQTEVIAVIAATTSPIVFVDRDLTPGTAYYYEVQPFAIDGTKGTVGATANASPTS